MTDEKIAQVKKELRSLSRLNRSIEAAVRARERHEKLLEILAQSPTKSAEEECRIRRIIDGLRIDESMRRSHEIEEKYIPAIQKLDRLDQIIVIEGIINGKAYWKIGRDIGYTEAGIKKRMQSIYIHLAELT